MRVLFVHGINEHGTEAAALREEWRAALLSGTGGAPEIAEAAFEMAYYADAINSASPVSQAGLTDLLSPSLKPAELEFVRTAISEIYPRARINRWTWTPPIASRNSALFRRSAMASAQMLDLAAGLDGRITGAVIATLRQIYGYLQDTQVQNAVDTIVLKKLDEFLAPDDPVKIVFGHSLGSLITFKLLRDHGARWKANSVRLFVTAGSPLNLVNKINKLPGAKARPGITQEWLNIYDTKDVVALRRGLSHPPFGQDIENDGTVDNDDDILSHAATGYLRHRPFGQRILSLL